MPRHATRRATPRRPRIARLAGGLALAATLTLGGLLVAIPGGTGPRGAAAASPPERLATHATRLEAAGHASVRTLARGEALHGPAAAPVPAPARLGWPRSGGAAPAPGGGDTDGSPAGAGTTPGGIGAAGTPEAAAAGSPEAGAAGSPEAGAAGSLEVAAAGGPGVVGTTWNGLTDQAISCGTSRPCLEPADPWVAVSATHVVQMVNQATRITNRSGGSAVQVSNRVFFGVSAWDGTAFASDPRVLYDPAHDRWIATLFAGTCHGGALFIAVSDGGDPTGTWQRHFLAFSHRWPDFPTLGYSSTLVAVGVNQFEVTCGSAGSVVVGDFAGASLHVMDWADLLDGGDPTVRSTDPVPGAFTFVPAAGLTAGDAIHAAVALDDGTKATAHVGYTSISGSVAGADLAVAVPVSLTGLPVPKLQQPPTPIDAGGLIGVQHNALDLRPTDAVWRGGRLAVATTASCLRGTSRRPCGRVIELATRADLGLPSLRQDLVVAPTSGYADTFMPGVGYSDDGTLWTVFSQSSASRMVSSWARRQVAADPPGSWSPGAALVAAGRGPYGGIAGAGLNHRWGDYVGVARDPAAPGSVWQANQMADTGGGWATRVARLGDDTTPPTVGTPWPFFVAGSRASTTSVPVRVAWNQADAGSGIAVARLERSVNGGPFAPVSLPVLASREVTLNLAYGTRYTFRVAATDNAGTTSGWTVAPSFTPTVYSEGSSRVTYSGTWVASHSSGYLGGAVRYASVARRRATISFSGLAVAWVATAAASRGSGRIYADGVHQGTYSTYRSSPSYRRIITGRTFTTVRAHTYRVEVVGTYGHPRVDLDAFIVLR